MRRKALRWLAALGLLAVVMAIAGYVVVARYSHRFEPYIREQAIEYLRKRFDSEVGIASLKIRLPKTSLFHLVRTRGRGAIARVEGTEILLRHHGRRDLPALLAMEKFG